MSCDKLYLKDSFRRCFVARVVAWSPAEPAGAAALDRTAFYPGGGGQPPDRGLIAGRSVNKVYLNGEAAAVARSGSGHESAADPAGDRPHGLIWHRFAPQAAGLPPLEPGEEVNCEVDWDRRFDFMQQHSGQHLISAVALAGFDAKTTGFHLTEGSATVDLAFPGTTADWAPDQVDRVLADLERAACREVFADRRVRLHFVAPGQTPEGLASGLKLRVREHGPAPKAEGTWRVVEIDGLDLSPCGGTHVRSTGQIGLITFQRWERIRDSVRVEFSCGWRAFELSTRHNRDLKRLARELSTHEREAVDQALGLLAEAVGREKDRAREMSVLLKKLLRYEAAELCAEAEGTGAGVAAVGSGTESAVQSDSGSGAARAPTRIVCRALCGRTRDELKQLAGMIADRPGYVALLGTCGGRVAGNRGTTGGPPEAPASPVLVFARAEDVDLDVRAPLAVAVGALRGRGGGRPHLAQGGGGDPAMLGPALKAALGRTRSLLGGRQVAERA